MVEQGDKTSSPICSILPKMLKILVALKNLLQTWLFADLFAIHLRILAMEEHKSTNEGS